MESRRICRVCLITDVKVFDLKTYPLHLYFEPFIVTNPLSLFSLPNTVCYECAAMLQKFYLFREKCIKGQTMLYQILDTEGSLNISLINKIDRKALNLASNLDFLDSGKPEYIIEYSHDKVVANNIPQLEIQGNRYLMDGPNNIPQFEVQQNQMDAQIEVKTEILDEIKCEDNEFSDYPFQVSSSDDEPLSKHKSKKKKKKKLERKKEKEAAAVDFFDSVCAFQTNIEEDIKAESIAIVTQPPKRRRGRPKKTAQDLTDTKKELDVSNSSILEDSAEPRPRGRGRPRKQKITKPVKRKTFDEYDNVEDYAIVIRLTPEEQIEQITKRQTSSNYMNSPYKCDICFKGYAQRNTWQHHMAKHSPSAGDMECSICRFRFKSDRILRKHLNIHAMKFQCRSCPVVCTTKTQAKQHQRWHKGVKYNCQYCDEEFSKWTSYLSHVRIKHPSQHVCCLCGYSFVSAFGLAMHRSMMHKDGDNEVPLIDSSSPLFCRLCDQHFTSDDAYRRHLVTSAKHSSDQTFSTGCKECGERFPDAEQLRLHHRKEHAKKRPANCGKQRDDSNKWPSKCIHCDETLVNARDQWAHFRKAHPDLPYPIVKGYICEICGKGFRSNAFLKYHKRTHFNVRAYKCAQCPKSFFNRTNLQIHEKNHSDLRPYPCSVCYKAFKSKGALDRHFRSHSGDKPYQCEVCGKAFNQSNSRKLHVRTVHLKQPTPYISKCRMARRKLGQAKLETGAHFNVLGLGLGSGL